MVEVEWDPVAGAELVDARAQVRAARQALRPSPAPRPVLARVPRVRPDVVVAHRYDRTRRSIPRQWLSGLALDKREGGRPGRFVPAPKRHRTGEAESFTSILKRAEGGLRRGRRTLVLGS